MPENRVRLAAVSFLNTRPLISALEDGRVPGYTIIKDVPSALPGLIEQGKADLGLLPAGYCIYHPDLEIASGSGIACRGPVRSILLITSTTAKDCTRIAATTHSMSSVKLLSVLMERHFRTHAKIYSAEDPMGEMALGRSDGALLIGDPALLADPGSLRCYDLGEEWFRFTGLPFVFAVWAGRDRECVRQAGPDLVRAMRLGRSEIPRLAAESAGPLGIPAELCEDYLSHYIIHDVGPAEMEGYAAFRDMIIGTSTKGDQNR